MSASNGICNFYCSVTASDKCSNSHIIQVHIKLNNPFNMLIVIIPTRFVRISNLNKHRLILTYFQIEFRIQCKSYTSDTHTDVTQTQITTSNLTTRVCNFTVCVFTHTTTMRLFYISLTLNLLNGAADTHAHSDARVCTFDNFRGPAVVCTIEYSSDVLFASAVLI